MTSGVFGVERAVLGLVVAERLQRAVDGRHGQLWPGVERAGALAGVAGPDEVELAVATTRLMSLVASASMRAWYSLSGSSGLLLADQPGQDHRFPCPALCRLHGVEVVAACAASSSGTPLRASTTASSVGSSSAVVRFVVGLLFGFLFLVRQPWP